MIRYIELGFLYPASTASLFCNFGLAFYLLLIGSFLCVPEAYFMSRIFINHIDSYFGSILSDSFRGVSFGSIRNKFADTQDEEQTSNSPLFYQISGTLTDGKNEHLFSNDISSLTNCDLLLVKIFAQDVVLYNICNDLSQIAEAEFVVNALHQEMEKFVNPKTFILVSTCLTWAKTRSVDPDDPDGVFTEDEYRMRRSHPSFRDHLALEKLVVKLGRTKKSLFSTYVVCCGLMYGMGEDTLHFLFKNAWLGEYNGMNLPVFGNGQNHIPTIHVNDVASILIHLVELQPKPRYILAVDDSKNTLEEIVKSISNALGNGKISNITREDALLIQDIDASLYDTLLVNLRMDARYVKDHLAFQWVCETGLVENIRSVVSQFKHKRHLFPLKLCMLGPPASGKTLIARQLATYYKIHHITVEEVITKQIDILKNLAARTRGTDDTDDENGNETRAEKSKDLLETLGENFASNSGRYDDNYIIEFLKLTLGSKPCQNQGYILDGYPKTFKQARELFGHFGVSQLQDSSEGQYLDLQSNIIPGYIFLLESTEDFLRNRIISLPQILIEGTHNTEEGFFRRFTDYQNLNSSDNTVINYFDEMEIDVVKFDITRDFNAMLDDIIQRMTNILGKPTNYGPTEQELLLIQQQEAHLYSITALMRRESYLTREMEDTSNKCTKDAVWAAQTKEISLQRQQFLHCQSMPLRNYLIKFVMPLLTKGLVNISKMTPDDPIDFLAEFLFKNNPCVT